MGKGLIACRSITYAQRAARILNNAGIRASMRRLPSNLPDIGCGHAVRVERERLNEAVSVMNKAGFPARSTFCEDENGDVIRCP